jgi:excisionase family DNA binding protein
MNVGTVPQLYTYQEIAAVFQVCARTVARWSRRLRVFRLGNTVRLPESEVEKLFREHLAAKHSPDLAERWTRVKRTRRPSIRVSNDTGTTSKRPCKGIGGHLSA